MSMIMNNIVTLLVVGGAYFLLLMLLPFWLRGFRLSGEKALDKLVSSFLYGNVTVMLAVITLSLLKIYYRSTLILLLVIVALVYRFVLKRKQTMKILKDLLSNLFLFAKGYYPMRVILGKLPSKIRGWFQTMFGKINNPIALAFTLAIFAVAAYYRCYYMVNFMQIPIVRTIDVFTHTEWMKFLMHNQPYYAGVYPFGYHSINAAISTIFDINIVTVVRAFGSISGMMIVFSLYYILRGTMKSKFAINVAMTLYIVTNVFSFGATERQWMALPQEYAMIFIYLTGYFLYKYMKDKQFKDLLNFGFGVALTLLTHFYGTIFAIFLCGAIFMFCIFHLNKKTFLRLAAGVLCGLLLAVTPLAGGLLKGIEFEGSMGWALSFLQTNNTQEQKANTNGSQNTPTESPQEDPDTASFAEQLMDLTSPELNFDALELTWLIPYAVSCVLSLLILLFPLKERKRFAVFAAFSCYSLFILLLYILARLHIFSLTESLRLYMFLIYSVPLIICMPLELLHYLLYGTKKAARIVYIVLASMLSVAGIGLMIKEQRFMPLSRTSQMQYNGTMLAYYDILRDFEPDKWIMVSSVMEYPLCLFEGWHYELSDFMMELENYTPETKLVMPAQDVFFFIEKRPIQWYSDPIKLDPLDENDAFVDLRQFDTRRSFLYSNYDSNRVLQAKAYVWAKEYQQFFPNEMTVFYEDDEMIVYQIHQDTYVPNNFSIPYLQLRKDQIDKGQILSDFPSEDNRIWVPLRAVFEALGAQVDWIPETQTVTAVKGDTKISLQIGDDFMIVNGAHKSIGIPSRLVNKRTMVPISVISETFDTQMQ